MQVKDQPVCSFVGLSLGRRAVMTASPFSPNLQKCAKVEFFLAEIFLGSK